MKKIAINTSHLMPHEPNRNLFVLSHIASKLLSKRKGVQVYANHYDITNIPLYERTDPDLIFVIEALDEDASAKGSCLQVVEIPDSIDYDIVSNRGFEVVVEKNKCWVGKSYSAA